MAKAGRGLNAGDDAVGSNPECCGEARVREKSREIPDLKRELRLSIEARQRG